MSHRAIFLDRDGVINKVVFRDGKPTAPWRLADFEIEAGVEEALERLRAAGFKLFVVTNQPDVARGLLPPQALRMMMEKLVATLAVDGVRVCPHDDPDHCECRKPRPGMLVDLAGEHDLALTECYIIGDSWKDALAGKAAGCRSILLDRPYNQGDPADYRAADLGQAVAFILASAEP